MVSTTTLILGGASAGKTARALLLAEQAGSPRLYLATTQVRDPDAREPLASHQSLRGVGWTTVDEALDLPSLLLDGLAQDHVVLVDGLTQWLSNLIDAGRDPDTETARLTDALSQRRSAAVLISHEVGLGLVPDTASGRAFRDAMGRMNQRVAAACERVEFIAAGLPLVLKG